MIPKHQQINVWMNMSETPEKKKTGLCYDNVLKTAWTGEWFDWIDFISKMQQNAPFKKAFCVCPSEKKSISSWFHHTIFKVFTTQILYPKCNWMHHFASFWKKIPPLPLLVSRGLTLMAYSLTNLRSAIHTFFKKCYFS
jgi:hypothetical protein